MNWTEEEYRKAFREWTGRKIGLDDSFRAFCLGAQWARTEIMHAMEQDNLMQWEADDER